MLKCNDKILTQQTINCPSPAQVNLGIGDPSALIAYKASDALAAEVTRGASIGAFNGTAGGRGSSAALWPAGRRLLADGLSDTEVVRAAMEKAGLSAVR